ncbi:MAG: GNAT family N-acetyltransferase, partial [Vibrio alginolyticus]
VASRLLNHVIEQAKHQGIQRLSLETGSMAFFEPAHRLYEKHGFAYCEQFGDYQPDPNSRFMTLAL